MLEVVVKTIMNAKKVQEAAERASKRAFSKAAFKMMQTARSLITKSDTASRPGSPPHSRRGRLQRAIRYHADASGAVIGPIQSMVGTAGSAHEFGGQFRRQEYPERPFMKPSLDKNLDTFAGEFSGSISQ